MYALIQVRQQFQLFPTNETDKYSSVSITKPYFRTISTGAETIDELKVIRKELGKGDFESNYIIIEHF